MGNQQSRSQTPNKPIAPMDTQRSRLPIPEIQFRVLIIGRANSGKTSILQRVCDTTESPVIYQGKQKFKLYPSMDGGEHTIDDELVFSNHRGYVFHDSRGIESGSTKELEILQDFIRRKCGEKRLQRRLHAIWYCVPMDNQRPQLELKFFKDICPDQNVPVIVVFTKHDQFLRNVAMHLSDYPNEYPDSNVSEVAETQFREHYVQPLGENIRFVQLKRMHMPNSRCDDLIEKTAAALSQDIVALMLFALQRDNVQLSVKVALNRVNLYTGSEVKHIVWECLFPFPYIWFWVPPNAKYTDLLYPKSYYLDYLDPQLLWASSSEQKASMLHFTKQIMSLPSIQILTISSVGRHHLILAVIIILKHATFLHLSNLSSESALRHADLQYQGANIDLKIQEYLETTSPEQSVMQFVGFIMATDIESMHPDM